MPRIRNATFWLDHLAAFFAAKAGDLSEVLDAESCREGWLHCELFRWFKKTADCKTFEVNHYAVAAGAKADIGCDGVRPMRGEIKLLGAGYQSKVITGGALRPILDRLGAPIGAADRDLSTGAWGLVPDYFRLVDAAPLPAGAARLLVLVAHVNDGATETLADVLRRIAFVGEKREVGMVSGVVRMWAIE